MTDSSDSTDSFRAQMPTTPEELTRTRLDRVERKVALHGQQLNTLTSMVGEVKEGMREHRRESQEGFKALSVELKGLGREDREQAIILVRQEAEQAALRKELEAAAASAGKASGRGGGAVAGLSVAGIVEAVRWLIELLSHRGGH